MEDGALDSLDVDEGCSEGEELGFWDSDGLEDGATLNEGEIEGTSLGYFWKIETLSLDNKKTLVKVHSLWWMLTWGSDGVLEGSAEVEGKLLGSELGFSDKLGDSEGYSVVGTNDGTLDSLGEMELDGSLDGAELNDGLSEGMMLGTSLGVITGKVDVLGP